MVTYQMGFVGTESLQVRENLTDMRWILCFLAPLMSFAQPSDLYLFTLTTQPDGSYAVEAPKYLSGFNAGGYTNQPAFIDENHLLVTAGPSTDLLETDLYELDLNSSRITRLTKTADREYSPSITPEKRTLTCVIVDATNTSEQWLWSYPTDLSSGGRAVIGDLTNVGYYCHLPDGWIAVFEVEDAPLLNLYNPASDEKSYVTNNAGRCLQRHPDGSLLFVHKHSDEYWFIKKIRPGERSQIVKKTLPGSEDFTILGDGSILMAQDSRLYLLQPDGDNLWHEIADLADYGIDRVTRLAHNGAGKLAVVTN